MKLYAVAALFIAAVVSAIYMRESEPILVNAEWKYYTKYLHFASISSGTEVLMLSCHPKVSKTIRVWVHVAKGRPVKAGAPIEVEATIAGGVTEKFLWKSSDTKYSASLSNGDKIVRKLMESDEFVIFKVNGIAVKFPMTRALSSIKRMLSACNIQLK